eukprot:CAMPEP_0168315394 /NCGR_PEP_ID=MMETSP0210-20121227/11104_1 /TAXON_ID=40633 /ORGANISM="Condylostoma magnum, Strain COL2" /LENGTH=124 /DNA_ID=CAMNT_0008288321 /DNA_START=340 /DNA_END=714 /DNA_ORIENTATION=+
MKDLDRYYNRDNFAPDDLANPCGLIPRSWNNDTYLLAHSSDPDVLIQIKRDDISWKIDKDEKFKRNSDEKLQWLDVEDEFFINWMSTAGLPNFLKLYGRIEEDLKSGDYLLRVNNTYSVDDFNG